jgi:hypothetical protein
MQELGIVFHKSSNKYTCIYVIYISIIPDFFPDIQKCFCNFLSTPSLHSTTPLHSITPLHNSTPSLHSTQVFIPSLRKHNLKSNNITGCKSFIHEMTKITISNQSHKSYRKYKSENGRTRTSEYIRGGIIHNKL